MFWDGPVHTMLSVSISLIVYGNGINNLVFQSILCRPENKPFVKCGLFLNCVLIESSQFTEHTIPECILVGKISINGLSDLQRLPKADKCGLVEFLKNILL